MPYRNYTTSQAVAAPGKSFLGGGRGQNSFMRCKIQKFAENSWFLQFFLLLGGKRKASIGGKEKPPLGEMSPLPPLVLPLHTAYAHWSAQLLNLLDLSQALLSCLWTLGLGQSFCKTRKCELYSGTRYCWHENPDNKVIYMTLALILHTL